MTENKQHNYEPGDFTYFYCVAYKTYYVYMITCNLFICKLYSQLSVSYMNLAIVHVQFFLKKIMNDLLLKNKANHVIEQKYQASNNLDLKISKLHNASNAYEVSVKVQYIHLDSKLLATI